MTSGTAAVPKTKRQFLEAAAFGSPRVPRNPWSPSTAEPATASTASRIGAQVDLKPGSFGEDGPGDPRGGAAGRFGGGAAAADRSPTGGAAC